MVRGECTARMSGSTNLLRLPAVRNLAQRMTVRLASADQRPQWSARRYVRSWPVAGIDAIRASSH